MTEKERKFVLKKLPKFLLGYNIRQGYLMFDGKKHLRVRIINNVDAYITFKTIHSAQVRTEYEYKIPLFDAQEMLASTKIKLEKTRFPATFEGNTVHIDIFKNGIQVVEIEYQNELVRIPDYCGEEVTGQKEFSNIHIAKYGQSL